MNRRHLLAAAAAVLFAAPLFAQTAPTPDPASAEDLVKVALDTEAGRIVLVGRSTAKLEPLARDIREMTGTEVRLTDDIAGGLRNADLIVTVTSAADAIIQPEHLKRGAVVCDVARPRDVSVRVARERKDVLVLEGGVVAVPGDVRFRKLKRPDEEFSFGFPPRTAYACMSETMLLALDGRFESFTLGKEVSVVQAEEMLRLAHRHGFRLSGFRSFERAVTEETIAEVRHAAGRTSALPEHIDGSPEPVVG